MSKDVGYSDSKKDRQGSENRRLKEKLAMALGALKSIEWVTGYKDENDRYYPRNTCTANRNFVEQAINAAEEE